VGRAPRSHLNRQLPLRRSQTRPAPCRATPRLAPHCLGCADGATRSPRTLKMRRTRRIWRQPCPPCAIDARKTGPLHVVTHVIPRPRKLSCCQRLHRAVAAYCSKPQIAIYRVGPPAPGERTVAKAGRHASDTLTRGLAISTVWRPRCPQTSPAAAPATTCAGVGRPIGPRRPADPGIAGTDSR